MHRSTSARFVVTCVLALACQVAAVAAAQDLLIEGSVRHADGNPAQGFEVRLEPQPASYARRLQELRPEAQPPPEAILELTADDGAFRISAPEPGPWRLRVVSPTGASVRTTLAPLLDSQRLDPLHFPQVRPSRIRVQDKSGQAIEGALVIVGGRFGGDQQLWVVDRIASRTNKDGWSEHTVIGAREVMVAADGYVPVRQQIDAAVTTVELSAGAPVTIEVRDPQRRPVASAVVRIGSSLLPVALTDEQGRATIMASPDEELSYGIESEALEYAALTLPRRATDSEAASATLRVRLEPPATVAGLVLDQKSGDPIAGALVWGTRRIEDATRTDETGRYLLTTWTSSSSVDLSVAAPGYSKVSTSQPLTEAQLIEMPHVSLWPVATLDGRVLDSSGGSLSDAKVVAYELTERHPGGHTRRLQEETTQADGHFKLSSLIRGSRHRIDIEHPRHVPQSREIAVPNDALLEPIVVTLDAGSSAWGRIVDRDGRAIVGAEVELFESKQSNSTREQWRARPPTTLRATSDTEGLFRLQAVAPGRHHLHATADGYAPAGVNGVEVPDDVGNVELGTLTLDPEARISGRVTDEQEQAIAEATISMYPSAATTVRNPPRFEQVTTNADGRFELDGLKAGEQLSLKVEASGYQTRQLDAQPSAKDLAIVLVPGATVSGRVLTQNREFMAEARVIAYPIVEENRPVAHLRTEFASTSADGTFSLTGLSPGRWQLSARGFDSAQGKASATLDLEVGQRINGIEMVMTLGPVITGTVTDEEGAPISGAVVAGVDSPRSWKPSVDRGRSRQTTDSRGAFRITGLSPGPVTLAAQHPDFKTASRQIELTGDTEVKLTMTSGFRITGRVVDDNGNPIEGASVWPGAGLERRGHRTVTDPEGRFALAGLESRFASITAAKEGYASTTETVTTSPQDSTPAEITIQLSSGATVNGSVVGLDESELAALELRMIGPGGILQARARYDATFSFSELAQGTWTLSAGLPDGRARSTLVVIDSESRVVDLSFNDGYTVSGVVISSRSLDGLARVMTRSSRTDGSRATSSSTTTLEADGSFLLEDVSPGLHTLMVSDGTAIIHQRRIDVSGDLHVEIELDYQGIQGIVVSTSGEPIAHANVSARTINGKPIHYGRTDSDGRFRLPPFEGSANLLVIAEGHASATLRLQPTADEVTVVLDPAAVLRVRLSGPDGAPISRGLLSLADDEGGPDNLLFGEQQGDGTQIFDQLPAGSHDVWVGAINAPFTRTQVEVPGDLTLSLPSGGLVVIEPIGIDENSLPRFVALTDANGRRYPAQRLLGALTSGLENTVPLYPSRWLLEMVLSDGRTPVTRFDIFEGQITRVRLDL